MNSYFVFRSGSWTFNDYALFFFFCDCILREKLEDEECNIVIVSGHAKGADVLGEHYACERRLQLDAYPADWKQYGRAAGIIRNKEMAESADALIAFPQEGEKSRGTWNMVKTARARGLKCDVVE